MKLTEEDLTDLFRTETMPDRSNCISKDTLIDLASGTDPRGTRRSVSDHLAVCSNCSDEYRLLLSLNEWARQEAALGEGIEGHKESWVDRCRSIFKPQYGFAAAVLLLLFISIPFLFLRYQLTEQSNTDVKRGGGSVAVSSDPTDDSVVLEAPEKLAWKSSEKAFGYKIALYDRESKTIWESGLIKGESVVIPEEVRAKLNPGQVYYWRIIIFDGSPRQSKLLSFRIQ